jgi:hypothetical protein
MNYCHFKISKCNLLMLFAKLFLFLPIVFLFAKLQYEIGTLAIIPGPLLDLFFITCYLFLGWMYRVGLDDIYLVHNQKVIKIKVNYNLYGFVFVRIIYGDGQNVAVRIWNPKDIKCSLSDDLAVDFLFAPNNTMPRGGCRLIIS